MPDVKSVIKQAAKHVYNANSDIVELDDLEQEATIYVVTKADLAEVVDNPGMLFHRLTRDLMDFIKPIKNRSAREYSLDAIMESEEAQTYVRPYVVIESGSGDYSRDSIETLLPAVWDESFLRGLPQRDTVPDPDMPRGSSNKAQGNNLPAYIADIKTGWEKTPLTLKERRALFLAYNTTLPGGPWSQTEIAKHEGVLQSVISRRLESAIGKVMARLNGGYWHELEQSA